MNKPTAIVPCGECQQEMEERFARREQCAEARVRELEQQLALAAEGRDFYFEKAETAESEDCKVCKAQNVIKIAGLARQAKEHGLHLVTDADLRVLEAMAKASLDYDRHHGRYIFECSEDELDVCDAELARRGGKP